MIWYLLQSKASMTPKFVLFRVVLFQQCQEVSLGPLALGVDSLDPAVIENLESESVLNGLGSGHGCASPIGQCNFSTAVKGILVLLPRHGWCRGMRS